MNKKIRACAASVRDIPSSDKDIFVNKNFPVPDEQFTGKGFRDIGGTIFKGSTSPTWDIIDEGIKGPDALKNALDIGRHCSEIFNDDLIQKSASSPQSTGNPIDEDTSPESTGDILEEDLEEKKDGR